MTDEELINLYGELTGQINESSDRQESLLANLQRCSQEFSHLKKSGAAEQQRETILASMSAAYDGFMEVNSNLEEGTKFYSDLTQERFHDHPLVSVQNWIQNLIHFRIVLEI